MAKKTTKRWLQLKVTLRGVRPPIWRRIVVPSDMRLNRLHDVLQIALGWTDTHLHAFESGREYISLPSEDSFDLPDHDERKVSVADFLKRAKQKLVYLYDFGDGWEHDIVLEKTVSAPATGKPSCTGGKRSLPPEDIGGPWGYQDFLKALEDPAHERHEEFSAWYGGAFDPDAFDMAELNEALHQPRRPSAGWARI